MSVRIICRSGVGWLEFHEGLISFGEHWDDKNNHYVAEQLERIADELRRRSGTGRGPTGTRIYQERRAPQMNLVASSSDELVTASG